MLNAPVDEVFAHIIHARRRESLDRSWQLMAANQPHLDADDQRKQFEAAARIASDVTPRLSAYDRVPDDTRPTLIGCAIKAGGQSWIEAHPNQMDWLRRKGITPADAVAAHDAWEAERAADPIWQELVGKKE